MYRIALFMLLCLAVTAKSEVRLPKIIGNNMVLQQNAKVKIWGWANPNEKVSVSGSWNNSVYKTTGSRDAKWEIEVETPAAGGPYVITVKGSNSIQINNVLIGEVWMCGGQSNMEMCGNWGLKSIRDEMPSAKNESIRFFHIQKRTSATAQEDVEGEWVMCDSNSLKSFSAVGYFFGKRLFTKLKKPVGLIEASWGGTAAEVWTPDSVVNHDPVLKQAAKIIPPSGMCPYIPGHAYNAMIFPVTNFYIAGAIWYQGENNTEAAATYKPLFTAMIEAWRSAWKRSFPFYYVQIAPFRYKKVNTGALLREAQLQSVTHPNTGMVVTTDLTDDVNDIHPQNKHDVGLRLANWALAATYGLPDIAYKSPLYKSMALKKNKVLIYTDAQKGLKLTGKKPVSLSVAGADGIFHEAECSIKANAILVWCKDVPEPVAVRYGFADTAIGNIFSNEGLPLAPFRTDNWPVPIL